jgi:hypothetical protein
MCCVVIRDRAYHALQDAVRRTGSVLLPLTVIGPAPLPSMVMECAALLSVSVDAKVMVVALGNAVAEKVMSALLVSVLACATAHGRLPLLDALLLVFVTSQVLGTTRSSSISI